MIRIEWSRTANRTGPKSWSSPARRAGAVIGGLLNVTFGNTAEFILALLVLGSGRPDVVKATITGSIVGKSQGMKNPLPRMRMLGGFNEGRVEFEGREAGSLK
jgi:Ca2+:H+ antiporter